MDTRGNLFAIVVHSADLPDREALVFLLAEFAHRSPRLLMILADAAYRLKDQAPLEQEYGIEIRIVDKAARQKGFVVQPLRWMVERSIAWWGRYRRLAKDYEAVAQYSESWIYLASIGRLLQRLFPDPAIEPPYQNQHRSSPSTPILSDRPGIAV